jgi:mRNA-degrading endonuclease toxin of MazEF toxin-antitoxin module
VSDRPPRQWEVWKVWLGEPVGHEQKGEHYAVVLSCSRVPDELGLATVAPITSGEHGPWTVKFDGHQARIPLTPSYVECHQVRTLSISPERFLWRVSKGIDESVRGKIRVALGSLFRDASEDGDSTPDV